MKLPPNELVRKCGNVSIRRPTAKRPREHRTTLRVEHLESRLAPAVHTWTGASGFDLSWSNPANWNGGVPTSGEQGGTVIAFPPVAAAVKPTVDDIPLLAVDQLMVTGAGYTINGAFSNA